MNTYDIINAGPKNRFTVNGRVISNSGRHIQLQNLVRNNLSTLDEARELVKMGAFDMLASIYGNVPDVLSQLCRTMLVPKPGHEFIVADFSAIEARVLAFLAGEEWRLEAFRNGEDIYCASASAMFGVPVVKHGINSELRAKGKVAELACIAAGQLVLTDCGEVPVEQVTTDMRLWDGEEWVSHDGVVYRGEREVIEYEGLTATPDHLVYVERKSGPMEFRIAAASGSRLVQTGDGGRAVRLGENNQSREAMESSDESLLRTNRVSRMWSNPMATPKQSYKRTVERVPELYTTKADTEVARPKINSREATMRKPKGSAVSQLWSKRNKVRISECNRCWTLSASRIWPSGQRTGNRQNQQQRKLCSRKYPFCGSQNKLWQSAHNCSESFRTEILAVCGNSSQTEIIARVEQGRNYSGCQESSHREEKKLARNTRAVKVYDILNAGQHHRFTVSGKLVHNCGYGGAAGALISMGALDMGLKESELPDIIDSWRTANPKIVQFWWDVEKAAVETIKDHKERKVSRVGFQFYAGTLWIVLPSGRKLAYIKPRLQPNRFGRMAVTYEGLNAANKWARGETYSGKLVENITQATARDLLAEAMWRMERAGLAIVGHVHDEVILEVPVDSITVDQVCAIMNQNPSWADGLPLSSAGYQGFYYFKD